MPKRMFEEIMGKIQGTVTKLWRDKYKGNHSEAKYGKLLKITDKNEILKITKEIKRYCPLKQLSTLKETKEVRQQRDNTFEVQKENNCQFTILYLPHKKLKKNIFTQEKQKVKEFVTSRPKNCKGSSSGRRNIIPKEITKIWKQQDKEQIEQREQRKE